jgi:hypothetical protein
MDAFSPLCPTTDECFVQFFRTLVHPSLLLCAGSYVLLWRRGSAVLTAATLMVTRDPRFRLVDGYNLEISDVMPQDAGDYVCQISEGENRDQIHTVEILGKHFTGKIECENMFAATEAIFLTNAPTQDGTPDSRLTRKVATVRTCFVFSALHERLTRTVKLMDIGCYIRSRM